MNNAVQSETFGIFRDKDTLAMTLPHVVDLSLYTVLYRTLNDTARENIRYLLLDFSEAEKLCDSGIAALMALQKLARYMRIRLLLLKTPVNMHDQINLVLPDAFWINMPGEDSRINAVKWQENFSKIH